MVFQFVATKIDEYRYPALGEMVDVGGYSLHLHCTGEGGEEAPTVVMDAGGGGTVLDWQLVQPEVAGFARVCTYDRAGMGWSDSGAQPRTSQQIVKELHTLLDNAGVQGPYVLVGHSFGGTNMQVYASQYPDEVAGMVLVDSAVEDEEKITFENSLQPSPLSYVLPKVLATIGVLRLPYTFGGETPRQTPLDLEDEQAAMAFQQHPKEIFAILDETSSHEESFDENRAAPMSLGDKPLTVLTSRPLPLEELEEEELTSAGLSQEQARQMASRMDELHSESQAALTQRSQNSKQIIAEGSGHYIHWDQPDRVIDAIREVVEAARNGNSV